MKTYAWKRAATYLALAILPALTACGQPPTSALNNNWNPWNPGGGVGGVNGGCAPITGPITFSGQQVYMDYANIVGGYVPYSANNLGQIFVGAGAGALPQAGYGQQMSTQSGSDGFMSMVVTQLMYAQGYPGQMPLPYSGYPNNYTAQQYPSGMQTQQWPGTSYVPNSWSPNYVQIQGNLQLSQAVIQDIMYQFGSMGGYGGGGYQYPYQNYQNPYQNYQYPGQFGYGQVPCVSGMAMNVGRWNNLIYGGQVYLYLNGTQHGYILYF